MVDLQCYFRIPFNLVAPALIRDKGSKSHLNFTMENFNHTKCQEHSAENPNIPPSWFIC